MPWIDLYIFFNIDKMQASSKIAGDVSKKRNASVMILSSSEKGQTLVGAVIVHDSHKSQGFFPLEFHFL